MHGSSLEVDYPTTKLRCWAKWVRFMNTTLDPLKMGCLYQLRTTAQLGTKSLRSGILCQWNWGDVTLWGLSKRTQRRDFWLNTNPSNVRRGTAMYADPRNRMSQRGVVLFHDLGRFWLCGNLDRQIVGFHLRFYSTAGCFYTILNNWWYAMWNEYCATPPSAISARPLLYPNLIVLNWSFSLMKHWNSTTVPILSAEVNLIYAQTMLYSFSLQKCLTFTLTRFVPLLI